MAAFSAERKRILKLIKARKAKIQKNSLHRDDTVLHLLPDVYELFFPTHQLVSHCPPNFRRLIVNLRYKQEQNLAVV